MTDYLIPFLKGFLLMASVIFAVGPQNAMLIRHGLRRDHPFLVATIFTFCDLLLISSGVLGVGYYISKIYWLHILLVYGGAAFLFLFAFKAFRYVIKGGQHLALNGTTPPGTLVATAIAVSLLNPGALVDTLVVVGSVSSQYALPKAIAFGLGAQAFSTSFFYLLAGCTRACAKWFDNPQTWRVIDAIMGLVTLWIGCHLIFFES